MEANASNLIPSGIEPVDKLMGGLESGQLYLVHGEASGKSLFGIKFLIEGLKHGENGALVIRYSPEDAVRRFARLGYDCLEDVYSGRLVILEYSDDIIQQISRLRELAPVLRELEWLLGETQPKRLVFDPFANLVVGEGHIESRVGEFTDWARSFGATVVFIANGESETATAVKAHTAEVFRFEMKESDDRATRFLAFEKSPAIPDQPIEVDPSRGVFLLERGKEPEHFFSMFQAPPLTSAATNQPQAHDEPAPAPPAAADEPAIAPSALEPDPNAAPRPLSEAVLDLPEEKPLSTAPLQALRAAPPAPEPPAPPALNATTFEVFADLLNELEEEIAPLDLDLTELETAHASADDQIAPPSPVGVEQPATGSEPALLDSPPVAEATVAEATVADAQIAESPVVEVALAEAEIAESSLAFDSRLLAEEQTTERATRHRRASDSKIDSMIAARAAEILLRPPDTDAEAELRPELAKSSKPERRVSNTEVAAVAEARPKDFHVFIIEDDAQSCEVIANALSDYTLEIAHDGVTGLAKLLAFKPDLVMLDIDLPIIDGFKVLENIRLSLNMPIIAVSGTRVRAGDRVMAAELGADYYLTKPFSPKELRHKARQLIARYRGINSWILNSPKSVAERAQPRAEAPREPAPIPFTEPVVVAVNTQGERFLPYEEFSVQVEARVKIAMDSGAAFSIVGCSLAQMTANGGQLALRLFELMGGLVRDTDMISTNSRNDIVVLLTEANANGARAFVSRLRDRVMSELRQEPTVWRRSFPDLEEAVGKTGAANPTNGSIIKRRVSDQGATDSSPMPSSEATSTQQANA